MRMRSSERPRLGRVLRPRLRRARRVRPVEDGRDARDGGADDAAVTYRKLVDLLDGEIAKRPWLGVPTCSHVHRGSYHCGEPQCWNWIGRREDSL